MTVEEINNEIFINRKKIEFEDDSEKKNSLLNKIRILNFKKEIEVIRQKIKQLE